MKKVISLLAIMLLLSSIFVLAQNEVSNTESCTGFWGKVSCILFGDPARKALAGKAVTEKTEPYAKKCAEGDVGSCKKTDSIAEVFNEAGFVNDPGTNQNENFQARKIWAERLYNEFGNTDEAKKRKYKGTKEQNKELLNILRDKELSRLAPLPKKPGQQQQTSTPRQAAESVATFLQGKEESEAPKTVSGTPTTPGAPATTAAGPGTLPEEQQAALRNALGDTIYKEYIGENGEFYNQYEVSEGMLKKDDGTTITITKPDSNGFRTASVTTKDGKGESVSLSSLNLNGQEVAVQTKSGQLEVFGETVKLPSGKTINSLKSETIGFSGEEKGDLGGIVNVDPQSGEVTLLNYDDETRKVKNTKTGEFESTSGDYYKKGDSGCSGSKGCYFPDGGILTTAERRSYAVDYDYKGSGGDKEPDVKEFYDKSGRKAGTEEGGVRILGRQDEKGQYTGEYEITEDGETITVKRGTSFTEDNYEGEEGVWVPVSSTRIDAAKQKIESLKQRLREARSEEPEPGAEELLIENHLLPEAEDELADAEAEAQSIVNKHKERINSVESGTTGALATTQDVFEAIYAVTSQMKQFPALSKLIFGEADFYKDQVAWADQTFAPLLGTNWFPSAFCETDERWADIEPEGKAVIKTVSGTYQAVASIQLERSGRRTPILCHKNPDEEGDDEYICGKDQVCVDDSFCWKDENGDGKPDRDEEEPLEGYFYKVTWAVSSPQDETLTPFVDENGVSVSFNIYLNPTTTAFGMITPQSVPLYNREGNIKSPIELRNGESDKDVIIKYSPNTYEEACIVWDKAPSTLKGRAAGAVSIPNVCFSVVTSEVGKVNWERSGQGGTSVSGSKGEISKNTDW